MKGHKRKTWKIKQVWAENGETPQIFVSIPSCFETFEERFFSAVEISSRLYR